MKSLKRLLPLLLIFLVTLPACSLTDSSEPERYQLLVEMQQEDFVPVTGFGSSHVYWATVEQSNRVIEERVRLNWSWFIDRRNGRLPHGLIEPGQQFSVNAEFSSSGSYLVRNAFTAFN